MMIYHFYYEKVGEEIYYNAHLDNYNSYACGLFRG